MVGFNPETQIKFEKALLAECGRCALYCCYAASLTANYAVNLTIYCLHIVKTHLNGQISPTMFGLGKFKATNLIRVEPFHQYFQVAAPRPPHREWHLICAQ